MNGWASYVQAIYFGIFLVGHGSFNANEALASDLSSVLPIVPSQMSRNWVKNRVNTMQQQAASKLVVTGNPLFLARICHQSVSRGLPNSPCGMCTPVCRPRELCKRCLSPVLCSSLPKTKQNPLHPENCPRILTSVFLDLFLGVLSPLLRPLMSITFSTKNLSRHHHVPSSLEIPVYFLAECHYIRLCATCVILLSFFSFSQRHPWRGSRGNVLIIWGLRMCSALNLITTSGPRTAL